MAAERKLAAAREELAYRIMAVCVGAWRMARTPPPHIVSAEDRQRYRAVVLAVGTKTVNVMI